MRIRALLSAIIISGMMLFGVGHSSLADAYLTPVNVTSVNGCVGVCAISPSFVSGFTAQSPGTVATLLANAPCNSSIVGWYGVVTDLYSGSANTNEVMRCSSSGLTFYWRPQRTDYAANISTTGGNTSLTCLVSAPSLFYSGTLASTLNINLNTTNCWPGARFDVASNVTLNLLGVNVTGLLGGLTKALGLNAHYTFIYDGANWQYYQ